MPDAVTPVEWELAATESMRRIVQRGTAWAMPEWAHSVHVEPVGLEPDREYFFRFTAGAVRSPVGRSRTAPAPDARPDRLRLAICSCQMYEHGYFGAYRRILDDRPDLILHLGDYIYEGSWGKDPVRSHGTPEAYTLEDYRARFALYRLDPDLQAAHGACPWVVAWDDHEVDNDYAGEVSERNDHPELFLARRTAAYRAYYEHMPLPRAAVPGGAHMRLHTTWRFGNLAQVAVLDGRQYRSVQACPKPGRRGSNTVSDCAELGDPRRSLLGAAQEEWLHASLAESDARWNLLAQQTLMTHLDEQPGPGVKYWTDGWNGYPGARSRLLQFLKEQRIANPVVLGGDIHAFVVSNLNLEPRNPGSEMVASEFVTTSISSYGLDQAIFDSRRAENPNMLFADSDTRGYLRLDVTRARLQADLIGISSARQPDPPGHTLASFIVEDGRPGPVKA